MWLIKVLRSFGWAGKGILRSIRGERNLRIHLTAIAYVTWAGVLAEVGRTEWGLLLLCFGLVTALELMNTAVEHLCDRVTAERDSAIAAAKDAAAGGVLLGALASVGVGAVVFGPWIAGGGLWTLVTTSPVFDGAFLLSLVPAAAWIAWNPKEKEM